LGHCDWAAACPRAPVARPGGGPPADARRRGLTVVLVTGDGGDEAFGVWDMGRIWSAVKQDVRCARPCGRSWGCDARLAAAPACPVWRRGPTRAGSPGGVDALQETLSGRSGSGSSAVVADTSAPSIRPWPAPRERVFAAICASRGGSLATPLNHPLSSPRWLAAVGRLGLGTGRQRCVLVLTVTGRHRLEPGLQGHFRRRALGPGQPAVAKDWDGTGVRYGGST